MIDLRSDTVTQPSEGMRQAMAMAPVGDDVLGEDPTVNQLESVAAARLGKEKALFLPSGTMANLVALLCQTRPGDSIILSELAHPYRFEGANLARFGGLLAKPVAGDSGKLTPEDISSRINKVDDPHISPTTLVAIENTTNLGGGTCYSLEEVNALGDCCQAFGLRMHCDGARLFNAAVALNTSVAMLASPCDSVSFCLSKGLGAPVGSLLAGTAELIHEARRVRKQLGGGLRQAGILASAGLFALEHHVADLAEDHRRAQQFRQQLESAGFRFLRPTVTNIVMFPTQQAEKDAATLAHHGVQVFAIGQSTLRAVFHRDITDADMNEAIRIFKQVLVP